MAKQAGREQTVDQATTRIMRMQRTGKTREIVLLVLAVAVLSGGTFLRNAIWHDNMTLWEDEVKKSLGKGRVHHNLGRVYDQAHLPLRAFNEYLMATYCNRT